MTEWLRLTGLNLLLLAMVAGSAPVGPAAATPDRKVSAPAAPAPVREEATGVAHEPLLPGMRLTYQSADGLQFVREILRPVDVIWFDGTLFQVTPVYDGRFDLYYLYHRSGGEIRVIGSWQNGRLERWGEYIPVFTPEALPQDQPLQTPAGEFARTRLMVDSYGRAWYASGIGLVQTDSFILVSYEHGKPRQIDL